MIDCGYWLAYLLTPQKVSINGFTALACATIQTLCSASAEINACMHISPLGELAWDSVYKLHSKHKLWGVCEKNTARSVESQSNKVEARSVLHWNIWERHYELIKPVMAEEKAAMKRLSHKACITTFNNRQKAFSSRITSLYDRKLSLVLIK